MSGPDRIWLEPERDIYAEEGRLWCEEDVWEDNEDGPGVEYVRADLVVDPTLLPRDEDITTAYIAANSTERPQQSANERETNHE